MVLVKHPGEPALHRPVKHLPGCVQGKNYVFSPLQLFYTSVLALLLSVGYKQKGRPAFSLLETNPSQLQPGYGKTPS